MNNQELNYIAGVLSRALADGCVVSVVDNEEDVVKLNHSRDRLAILEAVSHQSRIVFFNNIGGNWVGQFDVESLHEREDGVPVFMYDATGITGGEHRMKAIMGERAA